LSDLAARLTSAGSLRRRRRGFTAEQHRAQAVDLAAQRLAQ